MRSDGSSAILWPSWGTVVEPQLFANLCARGGGDEGKLAAGLV